MVSAELNKNVVADRALWIKRMIEAARELPLENKDAFLQNKLYIAAAESYLRRALEALFDLGRHILARQFAYPTTEYKTIADALFEKKIFSSSQRDIMRKMAGYRNRMVHFYHEISPEELYLICSRNLTDIEKILSTLLDWAKNNDVSE